MKYIVLLCDGMSDHKQPQLNGLTPMQAAKKPCMDALAGAGKIGLVQTIPRWSIEKGIKPGSDIANLSVLGYGSEDEYSGRSPLEAASIGIELAGDDLAMRCNLVTLTGGKKLKDCVMTDYCAGDISTAEAAQLIDALQTELGNDIFRFYSGVSYRHCLVQKTKKDDAGTLTPPHDILGQSVKDYLPKSKALLDLTEKSRDILENHPVNLERIAKGESPANCIWLWGQGRKANLASFSDKYGLQGAVISAVDLLKGIAVLTGMEIIDVPGATGYIDSNLEGKAYAALEALSQGTDFVYLHVEAPDECGHRGECENKVKAIEYIDRRVLDILKSKLDGSDYKLLILPDHATPLDLRTHTAEPVPFLMYSSRDEIYKPGMFDEDAAEQSGIFYDNARDLIEEFLDLK